VVYAKYPSFEKSPFRVLGSWLNRKMAEILTDKPTGIQGNSFYAMQRFVKDEMVRYTNSFPYLGGLVFRVTSNITEIDVEHRGRKEGTSNYTLGKLVKLWVNGFTAFSVLPLRIASLLGIIFSCIGFILGLVFVIRKLLNPEIILGFTSMIVIVLFLGGVILLAVGLIGEYVGRIYIGQNQAPQYVIKEKTWKTSIEENSNGAADH
jgi:undecaprenyl-phosphate 4-deoxy-4-formamido-L-arabinose transferase